MPIYEYECKSCGHRMEVIQKMSDEPLEQCPECDKPALKKLVSAGAFVLKGSGWYKTDFKDGPTKKAEPKADPPPSCANSTRAAAASSD